jgi:hypothetical protein
VWLYIPSASAQASKALALASKRPLSLSTADLMYRSCTSKGKCMRPQYWQVAWKRDAFLRLLSGLTWQRPSAQNAALTWLEQSLNLSSAESPASLGRLPETNAVQAMNATFGRTFGNSWSNWLLTPSSWKTSQDSLFETDLDESAKTYVTWVTKWRQSCSVLRTWVRATAGNDCSSWPTPHGLAGIDHTGKLGAGGEFAKAASNWTTPMAHDVTARGSGQKPCAKAGNRCLATDAKKWGTPRVTTNDGIPSPEVTGKGSRLEDQAGVWYTPDVPNGGRAGVDLVESKGMTVKGKRQVGLMNQTRQWPTPRTGGELRNTKRTPSQEAGKHGLYLAAEASLFSLPDLKANTGLSFSQWPQNLRRRYRAIQFFLNSKKVLNPSFGDWLQGLPPRWSCAGIGCGPSETEFVLYRRRLHTSCCMLLCATQTPTHTPGGTRITLGNSPKHLPLNRRGNDEKS